MNTAFDFKTSARRPVLRYHGGKFRLATWITSHFPPHKKYVEPFAGAASVLMRKGRSDVEIINDLDEEIVNVFRVLRDPASAARLRELLLLTPFARTEFAAAYEECADPVERARRTITRSYMGFSSASVTKAHKTGFRASSNRSRHVPAVDWALYPQHIDSFVERLRGVTIENRNAADIIRQHAGAETLLYVDPPYPFASRYESAKWRDCYRHDLTDADHRYFAQLLHEVEAKVVISGYDCALYRDLYADWKRVTKRALGSGNKSSVERTECLWISPRAEVVG